MKTLTPHEQIAHFCQTYDALQAKGELWKWLVLTVKSDTYLSAHVQTTEFNRFFDELNKLITAIYAVHKQG